MKNLKDVLKRNNDEVIDVDGQEMETQPKNKGGIAKKVIGGLLLAGAGALAGYGLCNHRSKKGSDSGDDTYEDYEDVSESDFEEA